MAAAHAGPGLTKGPGPQAVCASGAAYEPYVTRWSRLVVLPSISLKRKVTVPLGTAGMTAPWVRSTLMCSDYSSDVTAR